MAWEQTLLEAQFRGVVFDIESTDDVFEKAAAEHSYPYEHGADVEDLGENARRINVKAIFYGDDYEKRLNQFLVVLRQLGPGELIHPVFGSIPNVIAKRYPVHHDAESPDSATLEIEFLVSTPDAPFFSADQQSKISKITASTTVANQSATDKLAATLAKIQKANPFSGLQKLRQAITGPLIAAMNFANAVLANLDPLAYPRAWANDFSTLINGALDIRQWGAQLEADWASIKATFSLLDLFIKPSGAAPDAVDTTAPGTPSEAQGVAVVQATVGVFQATALADAVAAAFNAQTDALAGTGSAPLLTPAALEEMSNTARAAIAAAIVQVQAVYVLEDSRDIVEPLKDLALTVQASAAALIEARPPLVQRIAKAPGNMRLLAHELYGDSDRSDELYRLNNARNPFIDTGDVINAYAV